MLIEMDENGRLVVTSETYIESCALQWWTKRWIGDWENGLLVKGGIPESAEPKPPQIGKSLENVLRPNSKGRIL